MHLLPRAVEVDERLGPRGRRLELADQVERELGAVLVVGHREAELGEVGRERGRRTAEDGPATGEEDEAVEEAEDALARLVDGRDDNAAALRDAAKHLDDHERGGGVEPRRGLVEEQEDRVVDDVGADGHPAALPSGHPAVALVADDGVGRGAEAEMVDERLHARALLGRGQRPREAELGGEGERLGDGEHGEQQVVLHDVRGDGLDDGARERLPVERDGALERVAGDAVGERVDERGLAGAAGAHDGQDLALPRLPGDAVQQRPGGGGGDAVGAALQLGQAAGPAPALLGADAVGQAAEHQAEVHGPPDGHRSRTVDGASCHRVTSRRGGKRQREHGRGAVVVRGGCRVDGGGTDEAEHLGEGRVPAPLPHGRGRG